VAHGEEPPALGVAAVGEPAVDRAREGGVPEAVGRPRAEDNGNDSYDWGSNWCRGASGLGVEFQGNFDWTFFRPELVDPLDYCAKLGSGDSMDFCPYNMTAIKASSPETWWEENWMLVAVLAAVAVFCCCAAGVLAYCCGWCACCGGDAAAAGYARL